MTAGSDGGDEQHEGSVRREVIHATGHENVRATHESTLEVTTDDWLTPAGDCIVAVAADRAPADFDPAFVAACQQIDATIEVTVAGGDVEATVRGRGHPELTFESERSAVVRTSEYVDDRTIVVGADRSAGDLDRSLVEALADGASVDVTIVVNQG